MWKHVSNRIPLFIKQLQLWLRRGAGDVLPFPVTRHEDLGHVTRLSGRPEYAKFMADCAMLTVVNQHFSAGTISGPAPLSLIIPRMVGN